MALIELKNTPLSKAKEQYCVPFNKPTLIRGGCLGMPALKQGNIDSYKTVCNSKKNCIGFFEERSS